MKWAIVGWWVTDRGEKSRKVRDLRPTVLRAMSIRTIRTN
jgi:hypothetical protein